MAKKASELKRGDIFYLEVCCEVLEVVSVADGKRIKVVTTAQNPHGPIEYLDDGCVLAFVTKPGRQFVIWNGDDDDDDDNEDFVVDPPDPTQLVDA